MTGAVYALPWPPSVNGYWRAVVRGKRPAQILSERGRNFRLLAEQSIVFQGVREIRGDTEALIVLHPPTRRRFDVDNYAKAILDVLTHTGVLEDDAQIVRLVIEKGDRVKDGRADVRLIERGTNDSD